MSRFGRRRKRVGAAVFLVLGAGLLAAGSPGCQQKQSPASAEPQMSVTKVRALLGADSIISQGERDIEDAEKLRAKDPASAERLRQEGLDQIARGQAMKAEAAAMK